MLSVFHAFDDRDRAAGSPLDGADRPAHLEPLEPRLLLDGAILPQPAAPTTAPDEAILEPIQPLPPVPAEMLNPPVPDLRAAGQPLAAAAGTGVFDVYVEDGLLAQIQASVDQYVADLTAEGYTVAVQEFSGSAEDLRTHLQGRYGSAGLEGALLVGDLPTLTYTHENDFNGATVSFLHDLYFMDLDGQYLLSDTEPDQHVDGTGDIEPEIYVSRITTSSVTALTGLSEVELINRYFGKVHDYRTGVLTYRNRGILWSDDDWQWSASRMGGDLYDEVLNVRSAAETTRQSYVDCLGLDYESMFDMIHSSVTYHSISGTGGGSVNSSQIRDLNPRQAFYNLWNCSSGRFLSPSNLICTYVYSGDYGLNAVGSTKTGSMLSTEHFYDYQSEAFGANSIGQAFHYWWNQVNNSSDSMKSWHYGMVMQGDPTLRPAVMGDGSDQAPEAVDLLPASDTGQFDDDDVTARNNADGGSTLAFMVTGTLAGATVTVYADDVPIGSAVAGSGATLVFTDGSTALADGVRQITARQRDPGGALSVPSPVLSLTVDSQAPLLEAAEGLTATQAVLSFDGPLNSLAAETAENYQLDSGLLVEAAALEADGKTVTLTLIGQMAQDTPYTLTVSGLSDLAGNALWPDPQQHELLWAFDPLLIETGSEWRYLDDGSDQGAAWREEAFDDSPWPAGHAQLGYGDDDEQTVISYGGDSGNKHITTYFRHRFAVADASVVEALRIRLLRDDGAVVYLNGQELFRDNMPETGPIDYATLALQAVGGGSEDAYFEHDVPIDALHGGWNTLAVEIHQSSATSSDVSFDLELRAVEPTVRVSLVEAGSEWKYLDDGSDQAAAWRGWTFDDTDWAAGEAELGYGDGDEATLIGYGGDDGNKYITTYFRREFTVHDPSRIIDLTVRLLRDDGAVVYLNGQELFRDNMPETGTIDYLTTSSAGAGSTPSGEASFADHPIDPALLDDGLNLLAVEVHQVSATSSDVSFDLELRATMPPDPAPTVEQVRIGSTQWDASFRAAIGHDGYPIPTGEAQLDPIPWVNADEITLVFSEPVNVAIEDLAIYGVNVPQYSPTWFSYESETSTARWRLDEPIAADKLLLVLSESVTDADANALDGEWIDQVTSPSSGDGAAGGAFEFRLNILPGDADCSGEVRSSDTIKIRRAANTQPGDGGYSIFYDVDGSGEVRSDDTIKARRLSNTTLPDGDPTASLDSGGGSDPITPTVAPALLAAAAAAAAAQADTDTDPTPAAAPLDLLALPEIVPLAI